MNSAIQAGASGFVPKHSQRDVFLRAFAEIWSGGVYLPEGFVPVERDGGRAAFSRRRRRSGA